MEIEYTDLAKEQLADLSRIVQSRIKRKLQFYVEQKDPLQFAKRLIGRPMYRYRIGEYRVIFSVARSTMYVLMIVKRDKAYRDL